MASELNSVQESIKLALDAADAATDVTSEYSQIKREHRKLEKNVSQIHRYTTITFVTAMGAAVLSLGFSAMLYFKTLGELRLMTTTNREGLVVFAENIEHLNSVLGELSGSLEQQGELVALNREATSKITELAKLIGTSSEQLSADIKASSDAMVLSNEELGKYLGDTIVNQAMGHLNSVAVQLAGTESKLSKELDVVQKKLIDNTDIGALSASQKNTAAQVEMLAGQNMKMIKLLEIQQDRISFP
jgi:hypothetical protein